MDYQREKTHFSSSIQQNTRMYYSKENSNSVPTLHYKTPYARPAIEGVDPTVSKILKKTRPPENNYGKRLVLTKPLGLRHPNPNVPIIQNYDEPSTSYAAEMASYGCVDDVYGITLTSCYKSISNRSDYEPVHFRPRKSQLGNRTPENNLDHPLELKMMTIDDEVLENSKKSKSKTETPNKGFQIKTRHNLLRIFTGSVENLLHWSKLKTGLHILFEVTATVESIQPGKWKSEKKFCLSDFKSGPKLQVVYYEIDRPLPKLAIDSLVTCIGRLITRNLLQAYKVEECSEEKKNDLQRLSFICNRVADEVVTASQKK